MVTHEEAVEDVLAALEGIPMRHPMSKHILGCRYCQETALPKELRAWEAMNLILAPRLTEAQWEEMARKVWERVRGLARRPD